MPYRFEYHMTETAVLKNVVHPLRLIRFTCEPSLQAATKIWNNPGVVVGSLTNNQIRCPSRPISNPPNAEAAKSIRCFVGTVPLLSRCTRVAIAAYGKV
jgi:hypothetical protein